MAFRISYCPYRLLFKRPFGTAHGLRDGTDALFIRIEQDGIPGYGEVTLPPYLDETISAAIDSLKAIAALGFDSPEALLAVLQGPARMGMGSGCRAGITTALFDVIGKRTERSVNELLNIHQACSPITLMTIGICSPMEVAEALRELPGSGALKLKVGDPEARERIKLVMELDNRRLFLDGNQGFAGIKEAIELVQEIPAERLIGFEQPFGRDSDALSQGLGERTGTTVYADESVQDLEELERKHRTFGGMNVKLMKCGGLDNALVIMRRSRELALRVMLGSMSESSLGCSAMACLSSEADIVDPDGPWLIKNDPFQGIAMQGGRLVPMDGPGVGARLKAELPFEPFGA